MPKFTDQRIVSTRKPVRVNLHRKATLLLISLFLFIPAFAEVSIGDMQVVRLIRTTTLAVVQRKPDIRQLRNFSNDPEKLAAYKNLFEDYNHFLEQAIKQEWNLSTAVLFITEEEAEELKRNKDKRYCLLETTEIGANDFTRTPGSSAVKIGHRPSPIYDLDNGAGVPVLRIVNAAHPKRDLLNVAIPDIRLGELTMLWCVQRIKNQLLDCEIGLITSEESFEAFVTVRTHIIKRKTLLLCEDVMTDHLKERLRQQQLTQDDYSYAVEVVSYERLAELLKSHNDQYAYAWVVPNFYQHGARQQYDIEVVDVGDGRPLWSTAKHEYGKFDLCHLHHLHTVLDYKKVYADQSHQPSGL